jgi:hypothetical protein
MYHYQDKVKIVSGFYEGMEGTLVDMYTSYASYEINAESDTEDAVITYSVQLSKDKVVSVSEENLELV